MLTAEEARLIFRYDPDTGDVFWNQGIGQRVKSGDRAGCTDSEGYRIIVFRRRPYKAHRLIWLLVHGVWPSGLVDHINGDCSDNRLNNLRLATPNQNIRNSKRHKDNSSGFKGVVFQKHTKTNPWRACITYGGKSRHIGNFSTPEAAHAAYVAEAERVYGEFARAA